MLNGAERRAARIGYQVQFAREESLGSMTLTDIDEADIGQWTREKRFDPRARGGIECIERAIHHQPLWPAQTDPGEGQLLLFVLVQTSVPTIDGVKQWPKVSQTHLLERARDGRISVVGDGARIGERGRSVPGGT